MKGKVIGKVAGIKDVSTAALIRRINSGLPFKSIFQLANVLEVSEKEMRNLLLIPPSAIRYRKANGKLSIPESDRVIRYARLWELVLDLTEGDASVARKWLKASVVALQGQSPLIVAQTEVGMSEVESLIIRVSHGVYT